ncbi:class F sortase [Blastococcus brunescens]|uniref:Class F sortase n=1 Tax=Blastococcus brunescens TaxID=1564165 RepID=A0ABZ1AVU2_9ACTN|nr:class F sortase [Blastococcus sp. BMG 8361]WRL62685.1 class F sortase [Blastococcus sp. BMG 8361]
MALVGRRRRVLLAITALLTLTGAAPGTAAVAPEKLLATLGTSPGGPAAPARITVPSAGLDAPLASAGLDRSGALVPPADPAVAGWYADGPSPGETGPAVIAGHVDWAGAPGVFSGLAELDRGAEVFVRRADGSTVRFSVTRVLRLAKSEFPTTAVYAPTTGAELRLITCGGVFDRTRGSYQDNVVVFAEAIR